MVMSPDGNGNAVELTPGDTVGLAIDTTDADVEQLDTQLTITPDTDIAVVLGLAPIPPDSEGLEPASAVGTPRG